MSELKKRHDFEEGKVDSVAGIPQRTTDTESFGFPCECLRNYARKMCKKDSRNIKSSAKLCKKKYYFNAKKARIYHAE
jgi:hypothetical protein